MAKSRSKTTETMLRSYIGFVDDLYSDTPASARLDKFKKSLYFCSSNLSNPMFLSLAQDNLLISNELLNIHELMYKFMCTSKYKCLEFNAMKNLSSRYDPTSFTWNIPDDLFPFLISYICTTYIKKISSPSQFFEELDNYFYKVLEILETKLNYNKERVSGLYHEWTEEFFGRQYFYTLDSLYKIFAKNSSQENELRNSINKLTRILVDCPAYPNKIATYVNKLLNHYKMCLIEKAHTSTPAPDELLPFYKHTVPWKIASELPFISYLNSKLSEITQNLCSYIRTYLSTERKASKYKIAVNHIDKFSEECSEYILAIDTQLKNMKKELNAFYISVKDYPNISRGISDWKLTYNQINEEIHKDEIIKLFKKYYSEIQEAFKKFIKTVQKASGKHPENYTSLTIDRDYYSELIDTINLSQERLSQKLEDTLSELPHILHYHNPGYIQELSYPVECFFEDDILRITYELTGKYHDLPKEHIIHHFKTKGLVFSLFGFDVVTFLLNFDQMIDGL